MSTIAPFYHKPRFPCISFYVYMVKKPKKTGLAECISAKPLLQLSRSHKHLDQQQFQLRPIMLHISKMITTELPFSERKEKRKIY